MSGSRTRRGLAAAIACFMMAPICGSAQTTVHGRVTDAVTGLPVVNATVQIEATGLEGTIYADVPVADDGSYAWTGICELAEPPSQCIAQAFANGYIDNLQAFDPAATDVEIDFAMDLVPIVWITGTVRTAGSPMGGTYVTFEYLDGGDWVYDYDAPTNDDGAFAFRDLPGTYRVCAGGMGYGTIAQCYDHFNHGALFGEQDQTPITLANGETHASTDFDLVPGGAIAGTLHDAYAARPLANTVGSIEAYDADGMFLDSGPFTTDAAGRYRVSGLPDGTFYVGLDVDNVFVDHLQIYPDIACDNFDCPPATDGDPVEIVDGAEVDGIDFTLHPDVVVSGHVTDAEDGTPIASARVDIYVWASFLGYISVANATTDALGDYSLYVMPGVFNPAVRAAAPFVGVTYPDVPCITNSCVADGDAQTFQSGDRIAGLDFALAHGAGVAGHVADARTGLALSSAIMLFDASDNEVWQGETDANGDYATPGWIPGTFYVQAASYPAIACAFYDDRPCPFDGNPATAGATPIPVAVDEIRGGIDFNLMPDAIFASGFEQP